MKFFQSDMLVFFISGSNYFYSKFFSFIFHRIFFAFFYCGKTIAWDLRCVIVKIFIWISSGTHAKEINLFRDLLGTVCNFNTRLSHYCDVTNFPLISMFDSINISYKVSVSARAAFMIITFIISLFYLFFYLVYFLDILWCHSF